MKLKLYLSPGPFSTSWIYTVLIDNSYHQFDIENKELNIMYVYET
jgi:hypothetical protein